ncbi:MAG: tRNA uridine-5-carboxymethylaminomethyl(34) synthesis enzyme MnmG [Clostridia bacterium]|nr:tRNA uridine-5-carboxymethylaminomethyl(34) synthesis enzyme MnmG [Clostridia bacterium]MDD4386328.1 tRNA uridine-5-carboxymethylaminomethyl(34) synthesis enzyme MnmG [Clostridia bacterium]
MSYNAGEYDVVVIGGGHAGCEAALATSRLGKKTAMFIINMDTLANMPCNPSIGGTSKGHLVKELDALGGEMGKNADKTFIQSKMLNKSKGPAVHSLRMQSDRKKYHIEMKKTLENQANLDIYQAEIVEIITNDKKDKAIGVKTMIGAIYNTKTIIVATGTYLKGKIIIGEISYESGPDGVFPANDLSQNLIDIGVELRRFKTGTPSRININRMDLSKMEIQKGDNEISLFSYENVNNIDMINKNQVNCYLTYTNENTHKIILDNIHRSPLYSGQIEGIGPRYCPSIEDKVVRFRDRDRHQIFIEPLGEDTSEMYIQGMSSSMPEEIQIAMYRSVQGLENATLMRPAYAIEYDAIDSINLNLNLEYKSIEGLFFAGQVNGSSGYEEAAVQGLMAGINASLKIDNKGSFVIDRSEGYIGVLIDDLVTKGTNEPYRMMTSRAEYRLTLRQDNADLRLREKGYNIGLISQKIYNKFKIKREMIECEIERLKKLNIYPNEETNELFRKLGSSEIDVCHRASDLIKRSEISYDNLMALDKEKPNLSKDVTEQVEIHLKYEGYIKLQFSQIEEFKKLENKKLSQDINYSKIKGLCLEARQKLDKQKPLSVGQASRISGVSPADISVLLIYLSQIKRR